MDRVVLCRVSVRRPYVVVVAVVVVVVVVNVGCVERCCTIPPLLSYT